MRARISILGDDILCECVEAESIANLRIPLTDQALADLKAWAQDYRRAVRSRDQPQFLSLGRAIFNWLDVNGWASAWAKETGPRTLEIAVVDAESEAERALLDLPWETLASERGFLAADAIQPFVVFRGIGRARNATPMEPAYRDLRMLFMAASPEGQRELDFEAEEAAILEATERLPLQTAVEESGCLEFFRERLAQDGPFEAIHLSCHGDILENGNPALALENPEGGLALAEPGEFAKALGENKPALVFLSACRTAQSGSGKEAQSVEPYTRGLIRAGVANALGWDGSVYDEDATQFARAFYRELAERHTAPFAAAVARQEILAIHGGDPQKGRHWHLARVYAGSKGCGPCCDQGKPKRKLHKDTGFKAFLDKANSRVPVASAQEFVGRRRQAQQAIRALRQGTQSGVLIYGMGNLGKSSLAARIANRTPHLKTVVVFKRYDALALFDQLAAALPARERDPWKQAWGEAVANHPAKLGDALEELWEGAFDEQPILLIIDDLERILAKPKPGQTRTPVRSRDLGAGLAAVLRSFKSTDTASRLLLTSRFNFTLPDGGGGDLADGLERVQLRPMGDRERAKQWRAASRLAERPETETEDDESGPALAARAMETAGGNPGLQEILCRPILAGEWGAAKAAIEAIVGWKASGEVPVEENAAQEFFKRVSFETYRDALTEDQRAQLRAATLFSENLPVPAAALEAVGKAAGAADPEACLSRLTGLGLIDAWGELDGFAHAAANPLARPLAGDTLSDEETRLLATTALTPLAEAWRNEGGYFPIDARGVETARLALIGEASAELLNAAGGAAGSFLFRREHDAKAALRILQPALAKIEAQDGAPQPYLLRLASNCAERIGETGLQVALLERGLSLESDDKVSLAQIAVEHAVATLATEGPKNALDALKKASALFEEAGDVRSRAVTMGKIADILQWRGEHEEALRIRREEQLPVYERLGDVRSRAVTMGKIADILQWRGEHEEALRIRREEELPVYERLGDVRERAVTMGKIADILQGRGEHEEALRIRREEQLPVYERLGDVRSRAVTMGQIADILQGRGEHEEALRIRREEQLPVYERLGDVRSRAVTMGKIADILQGRGEHEEALRIRREEQLPVYERLGDVRERAVTMGKIADILQWRGEHEEALRIRREEELPVYERLGDVRERAVTMGKIADILQGRGEHEEALRIRREEELPVYERLGDVRERAVTMGKIADILQGRGEHEEALRIRREEQLPVYERLGDVRERAVTMGKIANILQGRGEHEEALRILVDEALPLAEKLQDIDVIANLRFSCAQIRLNRGGLEKGEAQAIYDDLMMSYALNQKLQRPDGVAFVGSLLGQVLAVAGHKKEAAAVLNQSASAFDQLGMADQAAQARALVVKLAEKNEPPS